MPCWYCGVRLRKGGLFQKTRDHVVPKSKGGIYTVDACLKCNQAKRNMSLENFRILRGGVEFWGERKARIEEEKISWIYNFDTGTSTVPKKLIAPTLVPRPVYEPTIDLSKIKQYPRSKKIKKKRKEQGLLPVGVNLPKTPDLRGQRSIPDLIGYQFGGLTVLRRITSKWVVECMCGNIEHRSTKAIRNPGNNFDACVECRRPVGKMRSDVFKMTGVQFTWEDCFQYFYGPYLEKRGKEELCPSNGEHAGIADVNSSSINETTQGSELSITLPPHPSEETNSWTPVNDVII